MEELFLRRFFAFQKLHIVNQQQVGFAISAPKILRGATLDRSDQLIRELLGADERDARICVALQQFVCDGLHQVRLAEPRVAVDEERVIQFAGRLCGRDGGRGGEFVALADHEVLKRVALGERREVRIRHSGRARLFIQRRNEQVHLRFGARRFVHHELDLQRMAECNRGEAGEESGMFGFIPFRGKLIRHTDG